MITIKQTLLMFPCCDKIRSCTLQIVSNLVVSIKELVSMGRGEGNSQLHHWLYRPLLVATSTKKGSINGKWRNVEGTKL